MTKEEAGKEAAEEVRKETLEACRKLGVFPEYIITRLKELAEFKGEKPFSFQGNITYSDPLDFPEVQKGALVELAKLLDIYPSERHQIEGELQINVIQYGQKVQKEEIDKKSE